MVIIKKKGKKGVAIIYLFMIGIVFFLLGMALAYPLSQTIGESKTDLNCSSPLISDQDKANCTTFDIMPMMYTGIIFGLGAILVGRLFA